MIQFFPVFINVVMPVFAIVLLGMIFGKKLDLQARTLTRAAYYIFVPAFVFRAISTANVPLKSALLMISFILAAHVLGVIVAVITGRVLGRSREMIAAFIMITAFGNVGNFGLAAIQFHLGDIALPYATIFYVTISTSGFAFCVGAAGWARGGSKGALTQVVKTPAILATIPAIFVSAGDITVPLMMTRMISLLAGAMIPVMLFALGLQLQEQGKVQLNKDVLIGSVLRLAVVPFMAILISPLFPMNQIQSTAGILQSAMPSAILVSIIARENDIVPHFATSVVIVSTLTSLLTLTLFMVFL